jgi:acyl carrier protein
MLSERTVIEIVSQLLDVEESALDADTPFTAIEGWDSVNAMRVLVYLEREIGTPVDYQRFMAAECIGDLWRACVQAVAT